MIRGRERFINQLYFSSDFLLIQIAFFTAWLLRFELYEESKVGVLPFQTYFFWSLVYGLIAILIGYVIGLYQPKRKKRLSFELSKVFQIHIFSMFMLLSLLFLFRIIDLSRSLLVIFLVLSIVYIWLFRIITKLALRNLRRKGYNKQFILILGAGALGQKYCNNIFNHPEYGFEVIGFLDDYSTKSVNIKGNTYKIIGDIDQLEETLNDRLVDEVIIALPIDAHSKYSHLISICERVGVRASIIPDFYKILPATPHFDTLGDIPLISVRDIPLDEMQNQLLKRLFDILFSLFAIILTSPVILLISIGIKLSSSGPIIFKQERVGMNRRTFQMYKFRSMKQSSETISNSTWTTENDPRRTKFGTFLRKTSLDELPQFFNVLKGDMSVVGPRPERPFFVDQFKEDIPKYMIKHHVRPGITGWAQVSGLRGDTSIEDRIVHDIFYIENWTLLFDIKIIIKTIVNGFVNKNAY